MKIFNNRYLRGSLLILFFAVGLSCEDSKEITYAPGEAITQEISNPYLQIVTGFVPFEVGTPEYEIEFNVINGVKALNKVNVYTTFNDAGTGKASNERLIGTYDITGEFRTVVTDAFTYDELKEGLTVEGAALPATDDGVFPGSGWEFRFEGEYVSGDTRSLLGQINMVLSKYAGIYKVSESTYMRIQVDPAVFPGPGVATWDGNEVFIGFVNQNTLSYNDAFGYFPWPGAGFEFSYDEEGKITSMEFPFGGYPGTNPPATCGETPTAFKNLSAYLEYNVCDESMVIIDNDATGEHVIKLTYGYEGAGGYRQMTETLTKIVD